MGFWAMLTGKEPNIFDILRNYKNAGQYGEYATEFVLNHNYLDGYFRTVRNAYVPYKGRTAEMDVLMIHEKGIYVFESKNYSGWIFGSADQLKWTQCLRNREKHSFYNPLKQNVTHCAALAHFLNISPEFVYSYIVFSQRCELKKVPNNTIHFTIVQRQYLLRALRRDLLGKALLFTHQQVDDLTNKLQDTVYVTMEQKQKHVSEIKLRNTGTVCPFCGAQLVVRKGKYGAFYGCSTYPKCKYTRKIQRGQ
ncbi:MAG: NERD domain-containing protein [Oscillospiraceae bacterium]|jgi:hypothetical protein|nr:NERD domain-containing protein [Oscillospiraceae bacterium]